MRKVRVYALMSSNAVNFVAQQVGGSISKTTAGLPATTVFALTLTDRELLSAAITELDITQVILDTADDGRINNVIDKLRKVLSTE